MKTIPVTGATGKVGSHFVTRLLQREHTVRLLVRQAQQAEAFQKLGVEAIGDLSQPESLASAVAGVQIVVHLAAFFRELTRSASGRPMRMVLWLWRTSPFPQGLSVLSSPARATSMVQVVIGLVAKMTPSNQQPRIHKARSRLNRRCWNCIAHEGWECVSCVWVLSIEKEIRMCMSPCRCYVNGIQQSGCIWCIMLMSPGIAACCYYRWNRWADLQCRR